MTKRDGNELMQAQFDKSNFLSVGLDIEYDRLPLRFQHITLKHYAVEKFNYELLGVESVGGIPGFYKPNLAFFQRYGAEGLKVLKNIIDRIHIDFPWIVVIIDFKQGDVKKTNVASAELAFEYLSADAVTVNPYLGGEPLQPFLKHGDKVIFVVCKTSNEGSHEFQDLNVEVEWKYQGGVMKKYIPLYQHVAERVADYWNLNKNCGLVVGATYPEHMEKVRKAAGDEIPTLIPGIGDQGGDLKKSILAGRNSKKSNFIISASGCIVSASDPCTEALALLGSIREINTK